MTDVPAVSIIVPIYNCAHFLSESLGSILAQTYPSLEVLVMDDGSTDGSAEIAAAIADCDPRVTVHSQPSNVGQFANVNAGITRARGDLVAVYHGDDVYHPEIVAREVEYLRRHEEAGAVFALVVFVDAGGEEFGRLGPLPPEIESAELLSYSLILNALLRHMSSFLPTPTALVRREVYEEVGAYRTDYGLRGDLDMWLRIARRRPLGILHEHLLNYRTGHENESSRYGFLRTEPELFFTLMDDRLAAGDLAHAEPAALAAYEAHRSADLLLVAANAYILGRGPECRALLRRVRPLQLVASRRVQRWRLLTLLVLLQALARLPHSEAVALMFRRRWHRAPQTRQRRPTPAPPIPQRGSSS